MSHKRISELDNSTTPSAADLVAVVDVDEPDIDKRTKHMTLGDMGTLFGVGLITSANGTSTIPDGSTSITVSHGVSGGDVVEIHPTNLNLVSQWSVQNKTATTFDIILVTSPGPNGAEFWWKVST